MRFSRILGLFEAIVDKNFIKNGIFELKFMKKSIFLQYLSDVAIGGTPGTRVPLFRPYFTCKFQKYTPKNENFEDFLYVVYHSSKTFSDVTAISKTFEKVAKVRKRWQGGIYFKKVAFKHPCDNSVFDIK